MNELMAERDQLKREIPQLETLANDHEKRARDARSLREAKKIRLREIDVQIGEAHMLSAATATMAAAEAARSDAEKSRTEVNAALAALKAKESEYDAKLKALAEPKA